MKYIYILKIMKIYNLCKINSMIWKCVDRWLIGLKEEWEFGLWIRMIT